MPDLLWRIGLVIYHDIGVITQIPHRINAVQVLFHRGIEIHEDIDHFVAGCLAPVVLGKFPELFRQILLRIIPRKVDALDPHPSQLLCYLCIGQSNVEALIDIHHGAAIDQLIQQFHPIFAGQQIGV